MSNDKNPVFQCQLCGKEFPYEDQDFPTYFGNIMPVCEICDSYMLGMEFNTPMFAYSDVVKAIFGKGSGNEVIQFSKRSDVEELAQVILWTEACGGMLMILPKENEGNGDEHYWAFIRKTAQNFKFLVVRFGYATDADPKLR
jgi:hypothetical protein